MESCEWNMLSSFLILIENDVNIDMQNKEGYTALMYSCINNNTKMISYLLEIH